MMVKHKLSMGFGPICRSALLDLNYVYNLIFLNIYFSVCIIQLLLVSVHEADILSTFRTRFKTFFLGKSHS